MKTKIFLLALLSGIIFFSCEDDKLDSIGMGMRPDGDYISVYDTILNVKGSTVKLDSIYAKSIMAYLGNIQDEDYGDIKAGFACQFYPARAFRLDSMVNVNEIDSIVLDLYYYSYVGDSIAPMEVTVYPVIKELEDNYYTTVDPRDFCDMNNPLARRAYTARDLNISDAKNDSLNSAGEPKLLTIPLPKELGYKFLENYKANGESNINEFLEFFPGIYCESTFGTGCIINVEVAAVSIFYQTYYADTDEDGVTEIKQGTTYAAYKVTKEITQLNTFENVHDSHLLEPSETQMFLKSPAGICSKITIPIAEIIEKVGNRKFSSVSISIPAESKRDDEYALPYPGVSLNSNPLSLPKILLIEPDSVKSFFEEKKIADSKSSFSTTFSSSTNTYEFTNISNVIQAAIDRAGDGEIEDLELLVIPVLVDRYLYQSSSSYSYIDYASYYYLQPSAVTLKKGDENLQIKIITSDIGKSE